MVIFCSNQRSKRSKAKEIISPLLNMPFRLIEEWHQKAKIRNAGSEYQQNPYFKKNFSIGSQSNHVSDKIVGINNVLKILFPIIFLVWKILISRKNKMRPRSWTYNTHCLVWCWHWFCTLFRQEQTHSNIQFLTQHLWHTSFVLKGGFKE